MVPVFVAHVDVTLFARIAKLLLDKSSEVVIAWKLEP
jgi:hypothetical protein